MREPKPSWAEVPEALKSSMEDRLQSGIVRAEIAWGGYTPSANFKITLHDGREVFCKALHEGQTEVGRRAFHAELSFFKNLKWLEKWAPRFLGDVSEGDWSAMLFEFMADRVSVPPWTQCHLREFLSRLNGLHSLNVETGKGVDHISQNEFSKDLYLGRDCWVHLRDEETCRGFSTLFADPQKVQAWVDLFLPRLMDLAEGASRCRWKEGFVHVDLRSDNILFSRSRGPLMVDWPQLTIGPRALDLVFLAPSIAGEGGPQLEEVLATYEDVSEMKFSSEEILSALTLTAGYFAARAFLPPMKELPRLRWIQKLQLYPAMKWLVERVDRKSLSLFEPASG